MYDFIHYAEFCFLGAGVLALFVGGYIQSQHLKDCPRIVADTQFQEFLGMVRLRMYLSLLVVVAVIPAVVLLFLERPGLPMVWRVWLLLPYLVLAVLGFQGRRMEVKVRDPNRCDPKYQADFVRVCSSWKKRLLPDF